jgi:glycosyltransferase involved in cell wall biosynthesis
MKLTKSLVSIVVPVYNVEEFLQECMLSVLSQTYENIEIILVDDGSTDSSGALCDEYAKSDRRISVIHQKNRGVSAARNAGMDSAHGEYITFIDADDAIHRNFVKYLREDLVKHNATTVTTAKDVASRKQKLLSETVQDADILVLSTEDTMRELYRGTLEGTRNGVQVFNLAMLNENKIRYDERMAVGEDFNFFARAILVSNKVVVDRRRMYLYRSNPASAMLQSFNSKHYDAIKNVENVGRMVEGKIPGLKKAVDTMVFSDAIFYGAKMLAVRKQWANEYREIEHCINEYKFMVLANNKAKRNARIKALIMIVFGVNLGLRVSRRLIKW